ncbi:MAG: cytochrome c family protein, partial [Planctomycetes bacterium]|nr:cytochrome c family protein [Planctomycetota bacterium]
THPTNGLVIENTFEEWKKGPYAEAGIQCQDCHMRTVAESVTVAETMKPLRVAGRTTQGPDERPDTHAHLFVGANSNVSATGIGASHAAAAEARLKSAATVALTLPPKAAAGSKVSVEVAVTNTAAGHAIPTSITELRQVWIDLRVTDAAGREVYRSGAIDAAGRVDPTAVMYHSVLADEKGEVTLLPWRAVKMLSDKAIPPKATVRERYEIALPSNAAAPFAVTATLRYRSAPQDALDTIFGKGKIVVAAVDMATAAGSVAGE